MIDIYQASEAVLAQWQAASDERDGIRSVQQRLAHYTWVGVVSTTELDIAFAAAGGNSAWLQEVSVSAELQLPRPTTFADILVERQAGFVHLATPPGFLPLVDVEVVQFQLRQRALN